VHHNTNRTLGLTIGFERFAGPTTSEADGPSPNEDRNTLARLVVDLPVAEAFGICA